MTTATAAHKLTSGERYLGLMLAEIARTEEGLAYLEFIPRGWGEFSPEDRAATRAFLKSRPRVTTPPAPPAEAVRPSATQSRRR
jgi:hypothetical protein